MSLSIRFGFVFLLLFHFSTCKRKWAIEFSHGSIEKFDEYEEKYGLVHEGTLEVFPHIHLFSTDDNSPKRDVSHAAFVEFLENSKETQEHSVKWFEEQIPKKREKRYKVNDPLYPKQWHLHDNKGFDLNVQPVWDQEIFGEGIRIAIVDDGIDSNHPDIKDNIRINSSRNFNVQPNIDSPDPRYVEGPSGDWHGTASAGAAAARDDGSSCGVGVAPHAELAGIAILQNNADVDDSTEANALSYKYDMNHIYSNSWGPIRPGSSGHKNEAPGPLAQKSIEKAIKEGRNGLGSIYVWAAGNDGKYFDNCNYDGYANMRYAVLVGSTDHNGMKPSYSEPCAALAVVAPGGTQSPETRIHTTDLRGEDGLENSDCTTFAGTSASCPMAAGVIALILQVNPTLSWLELQYVIALGSTKHNDDDWKLNGAGQWVSHNYGWGLMNASRLVDAARAWGNRKIVEKLISFKNEEPMIGISEIEVNETMNVHHVEVRLWTDHKNVADTDIVLTSPSGTSAVLAEKHDDKLSKWVGWKFLSRMHWGENVYGTWSLSVQGGGDDKHIQKWTLDLYGDSDTWKDGNPEEISPQIMTTPTGNPEEIPPQIIFQEIPQTMEPENEYVTNLEDTKDTGDMMDNLEYETDSKNGPYIPLTTSPWNLNTLNTIVIGAVFVAFILGFTFGIFYKYYYRTSGP